MRLGGVFFWVSTWSLKRSRHALSTETALLTHGGFGKGQRGAPPSHANACPLYHMIYNTVLGGDIVWGYRLKLMLQKIAVVQSYVASGLHVNAMTNLGVRSVDLMLQRHRGCAEIYGFWKSCECDVRASVCATEIRSCC